VTWEEADDSDIVTCWMPLVDATVENGCMEVMPGVFRHGYREHQAEGGTTIRPDLLPEVPARPVPVRKGGVIFMHRHTPHRSTPNLTDRVRWSLDLRYQRTGTPTGRPFHPSSLPASAPGPTPARGSSGMARVALSACCQSRSRVLLRASPGGRGGVPVASRVRPGQVPSGARPVSRVIGEGVDGAVGWARLNSAPAAVHGPQAGLFVREGPAEMSPEKPALWGARTRVSRGEAVSFLALTRKNAVRSWSPAILGVPERHLPCWPPPC
jgi:hypothetical protein